MRRNLTCWGAVLGFAVVTTGCLSKVSRGGLTPGDGGSVLASIEGIDDIDRDNEKTEYWLKCDEGVQVMHSKIVKGSDDKEFLQFDGKQIKDGYKCGMEVWNKDAAKDPSYVWYAKQNDVEVKGLLYGSNKSDVTGRKLSLTIYKAYSKTDEPSFSAKFAVSFDGDSALAKDRMLATLVCGEGEAKTSHSSDLVAFEADTRKATITIKYLPVAKLNEKTCAEMQVVEKSGVDASVVDRTFVGLLSDVAFTGENVAEIGKELSFPTEGKDPYVLSILDVGPIDTTIKPGECFNIVLGAEDCTDKRLFDLPHSDNYLVAYVKGRTDQGRGEPREYIVGVGELGFAAMKGTEFNVDMLNKALASDDELVVKSFNFWRGNTEIAADIKAGKLLTSAMISGEAYAGSEIDRDALADIKFLHVDKLWVHGFHAVDDINAEVPSLSWLAVVEAKSDTNTLSYIVGGSDRGFVSDEYPLQADNSGSSLFSFAEFVADAADGSLTKWRALQSKENFVATTECTMESNRQILSEASLAVVAAEDGLGSKLAACQADLAALEGLSVADYNVTVTGYRLGWKLISAK